MARKKFYAVKVGNKVGIFESWPECYDAIHAYSRPVFSAFFSKEEALAFLAKKDTEPQIQDTPVQDS